MDLEHMNERERYDIIVEMADMYYKQGKTQSEIAAAFQTNRFRVAKLLQDALNEHIVEITIKYATARNKAAEAELQRLYPLNKAIVVNTQYVSQIENLSLIGKMAASYLTRIMERDCTVGVTWGKTVHSVVTQLPDRVYNAVQAVQLTGDPKLTNPNFDTRELVRTIASRTNGSYYYLNCPLYIHSPELRRAIVQEPGIAETIRTAERMDIILSGIGGISSLPLTNPVAEPYLTDADRAMASDCIGSIYGYVLNRQGQISSLPLNQKVVTVPLDSILATPHRLVVASGRHKVGVLRAALKAGLYNELLTDSDTAMNMIEKAK